MDRKKSFKNLAVLIIFIFVAHMLATKFYWYYSIWYFDMIMHFLGGVWLGLCAIYLFTPKSSSLRSIFLVLFFVLTVGLGWEVFEFIFYNYFAQHFFDVSDTFSDIFFDLTGGVFATSYFFRKIMLQ